MNRKSIMSWSQNNIPIQFQSNELRVFFQAFDQVIINNIDTLIKELHSHYSLEGEEKYIFMNNNVHVLVRWFFKDVLLGVKNIGESVIIIDPSSLSFELQGSLIIDVTDVFFTSYNLSDFKSIIATLTKKMGRLVERIVDNLRTTIDKTTSTSPSPLYRNTVSQASPSPMFSFSSPPSPSESSSSQFKIPSFTVPSFSKQAIMGSKIEPKIIPPVTKASIEDSIFDISKIPSVPTVKKEEKKEKSKRGRKRKKAITDEKESSDTEKKKKTTRKTKKKDSESSDTKITKESNGDNIDDKEDENKTKKIDPIKLPKIPKIPRITD